MPRPQQRSRSTTPPPLRYRQVHLDFHTSPLIPDVARDFDPRTFARTFVDAHVDSVTLFAKCHHGHLYYNTPHPARHPSLPRNLDLLRKQIDALHAEGIRAPIYLSVQCDEYAANTHPEWVSVRPDTGQVKWGGGQAFSPGWQILDLSSPYQDYVADQLAEILRLFAPVDGLFFDMCWDQPSCSKYAIAGMRKLDLNPESESDRNTYANHVTHTYMARYSDMVKQASPAASVYFNGRPYHALPADLKYQTQVEIEALPTGGWGYTFFPKNVRYARNFGKPYMGMTARFHKSWADFGGLKPYPALEYETSQMMAHGARCSIGDQLHPRGTLDPAAYALIGRVYQRVADREPWLTDATPVVQIGLFNLPASFSTHGSISGTDEGAVRLLTQLRHQFDVIDADSDLAKYELLILPDALPLTPALTRKLTAYLKSGGKLLATGTSGLSDDGQRLLLKQLPIRPHGPSPFTTTYLRFTPHATPNSRNATRCASPDPFNPLAPADLPATDHVVYDRGLRVTPTRGATPLAHVVEPYFERTWDHFSSHFQTPPDKLTPYAAAVHQGNTAYINFPVFRSFAQHGNASFRHLVAATLNRLLPHPLVRAPGPTGLEITVTRQPTGRTVLHALHYAPERRTPNLDLVEDIVPLHDLPISLSLPKRPRRAHLVPGQQDLPFQYRANRVEFVLPELRGHAMVAFE